MTDQDQPSFQAERPENTAEFSLTAFRHNLKQLSKKAVMTWLRGQFALARYRLNQTQEIIQPENVISVEGKGLCSICNKRRKLGQRGHGRGKCKKCKDMGERTVPSAPISNV